MSAPLPYTIPPTQQQLTERSSKALERVLWALLGFSLLSGGLLGAASIWLCTWRVAWLLIGPDWLPPWLTFNAMLFGWLRSYLAELRRSLSSQQRSETVRLKNLRLRFNTYLTATQWGLGPGAGILLILGVYALALLYKRLDVFNQLPISTLSW